MTQQITRTIGGCVGCPQVTACRGSMLKCIHTRRKQG